MKSLMLTPGFLRAVKTFVIDVRHQRETRVRRERDAYGCFREETADRHLITIILGEYDSWLLVASGRVIRLRRSDA